MVEVYNYLVTREYALRTGDLQHKYRTTDGRFVIDSRTLRKLGYSDTYVSNGNIDGVQRITREEARTLIARGGYKMGDNK